MYFDLFSTCWKFEVTALAKAASGVFLCKQVRLMTKPLLRLGYVATDCSGVYLVPILAHEPGDDEYAYRYGARRYDSLSNAKNERLSFRCVILGWGLSESTQFNNNENPPNLSKQIRSLQMLLDLAGVRCGTLLLGALDFRSPIQFACLLPVPDSPTNAALL